MQSKFISTAILLVVSGVMLTIAPAAPAQDLEEVKIESIKVAGNVHMLLGRGGNIGVSVGDDGVFMIDDQFAPLTEKITAAIAELSDQPIRFLINTHWHGDHTGGNENLGKAGAIIVAHENVRKRMNADQVMEAFGRTVEASPSDALPVITFAESVTFHWNNDELHVFHVPHAHTDGDAIIHFINANVIHMGDTYFNGLYPFIDPGSGGVIDGMIAATDIAMKLADDETKIIPGHGPLSNVKELREYHKMLITIRSNIDKLIADGKNHDEVITAKPSAAFDDKWGGGFLNPDRFVGLVYDGIVKNRQSK